jgi:hypothetical protein
MINKLLLVRKANSKSNLLEEAGVSQFLKGDPLKVSPLAWHEEAGISHYGHILANLKLDDLNKLLEWALATEGTTVLDYDNDTVATLKLVGLRVNEAA